jgi:hypothetical protein
MVEFAFRLIASGLLVLLAGWFGTPDFSVAVKIALGVGFYAAIGYWSNLRGHKNEGSAGLLAGADAGALAFIIGSIGQLEHLGFMVILPCLYAVRRCSSSPAAMVPIAAAGVFGAFNIFSGKDPSVLLYAQAGAVLIFGLLLNPAPVKEPAATVVVTAVEPEPMVDAESVIAMRENYRKLRDHCRDVERRAKADRLAVQLYGSRLPNGEKFYSKLAQRVQDVTGAESVALYTVAQFDQTMVVRATSGELPEHVQDKSFKMDLAKAPRTITDNVELSLRATLSEERRGKVATILLHSASRVIGMLNLFHSEWEKMHEVKLAGEEAADLISFLLEEEEQRKRDQRKLRELEVLYETAIITLGAVNRTEMASRLTKKLPLFIPAEFIGVYFLERDTVQLAAYSGREMPVFDGLSFAAGPGIGGWLGVGAPDLAMFETSQDPRCDADLMLKRRIGSVITIPLQYGEDPFGFIVASARASGALDLEDLQSLRAVAGEFSQAVSRTEQPTQHTYGLVTPSSLQTLVSERSSGCLVYFELLKKGRLTDMCSSQAIETALGEFARRARGKLPAGGAICQRSQGDFVAYLPSEREESARSWANDLAATASMIAVASASSTKPVLLAFRARAAMLGQQTNEVFSASAA